MKITCPSCHQSKEGFSVVLPVMVSVDIDAHGEQKGGADYGAEGRKRHLNCPACGHSWQTRRWFDLSIDVR